MVRFKGGLGLGERKEGLLFRKKEAKNFYTLASASPDGLGPGFKSFLVLFFKKEHLPS
jgi:hypothetical protein